MGYYVWEDNRLGAATDVGGERGSVMSVPFLSHNLLTEFFSC